MPWYTITWIDSLQVPVKREILHRYDESQVMEFCGRRITKMDMKVPRGAKGFYYRDAKDFETTDWDYEEPYRPSFRAIEIDIPDEEMEASKPKPQFPPEVEEALEKYREEVAKGYNESRSLDL